MKKNNIKNADNDFIPTSYDEDDKLRRPSLTDTPITSSSSEGISSNEISSSSSPIDSKKKKKLRQKSEFESKIKNSPPTVSQQFSPVYSSANNISTTKSVWTSSTISSGFDNGVSVANCDVNVVVNYNRDLIPSETNGKWMKNLRDRLNDGDADGFFGGIRMLCLIMCRGSSTFQNLTRNSLVLHVVDNLIKSYYDQENYNTLFMSLSSAAGKKCSEIKHGYCRIMRTLLRILTPQLASYYLSISSKKSGKTALHWAVETGELCQVRVLLEYDVAVGKRDKNKHTALYYALQRKDLEKVKHLLWYGADFSQCSSEKFNEKLLLQAQAFDPVEIYPWFESRTMAIQKKFHEFVSLICRNIFIIKAEDALSDLHTIRLSRGFDTNSRVNKFESPADWVFRVSTLNIRENFDDSENNLGIPVVFFTPFCYQKLDIESPADLPSILRASLFVKTCDGHKHPVPLFPSNPLIQTQNHEVLELTPVIEPVHNGFVYAYRMPSNLQKRPYTMTLHLDTKGLDDQFVRTVLLGIQIFRVFPQVVDFKKIE